MSNNRNLAERGEIGKNRHQGSFMRRRYESGPAEKQADRRANMGNEILNTLLTRMAGKQVRPQELPGLLRDVLNLISRRGSARAPELNKDLTRLGWQDGLVDEFSLEIMKRLIEDMDGNPAFMLNPDSS